MPLGQTTVLGSLRSCALQSFATLVSTTKVAAMALLLFGLPSVSPTQQVALYASPAGNIHHWERQKVCGSCFWRQRAEH